MYTLIVLHGNSLPHVLDGVFVYVCFSAANNNSNNNNSSNERHCVRAMDREMDAIAMPKESSLWKHRPRILIYVLYASSMCLTKMWMNSDKWASSLHWLSICLALATLCLCTKIHCTLCVHLMYIKHWNSTTKTKTNRHRLHGNKT